MIKKPSKTDNDHAESTNDFGQLPLEWERISDFVTDQIMVLDNDFRILRVNRASCEFIGKDKREIIGEACYKVFHDRKVPPEACPFKKLKEFNKKESFELHLPEKNIWFLITVDPVLDEKKKLVGVVHIMREITDWKKKDEETVKLRQHLEDVMEKRTAKLHDAILSLKREILERRNVEERLHTTLSFKSDFFANFSHELRTPLNSIIGYTDLILKDKEIVLTEKRVRNLGAILTSANLLLNLIQNILDLAKVEAGQMDVDFQKVNVTNLLNSCVSTAEGLVGNKPIKIIKQIPVDIPKLYTDPEKLVQIVMNLLTNAIKFTENGQITLSVRVDEGSKDFIIIDVMDTGIGIPHDQIKLIFKQYKQIDASPTRKYSGTGLGLPIVRAYAELMGGEVFVKSKVDEGSVFSVRLPMDSSVLQ